MKATSRLLGALGLAGAMVMGSGSAQATATQVFSTFGPGFLSNGPLNAGEQCIQGADTNACGHSVSLTGAFQFSPSNSGTLDHLDVAICNGEAGFQGYVVALVNDNGGAPNVVTNVLETFVATKTPACTNKVHTKLTSKLHPALTSGTNYWLVVLPLGWDTLVADEGSVSGTGQVCGSENDGATWGCSLAKTTAFDVWKQ